TLDDQDESGTTQQNEASDGLHSLAYAILEVGLLHFPPIETEDLCQNPCALSHPLAPFDFPKPNGLPTAWCGIDRPAPFYWRGARPGGCSREIDRGASRGTPRAGPDPYPDHSARAPFPRYATLNIAKSHGPTSDEERPFFSNSSSRSTRRLGKAPSKSASSR